MGDVTDEVTRKIGARRLGGYFVCHGSLSRISSRISVTDLLSRADLEVISSVTDLRQTTFHLVALGAAGKVIVRKKFNRKQLLVYTANVPASLIGLEAARGSLSRARAAQARS